MPSIASVPWSGRSRKVNGKLDRHVWRSCLSFWGILITTLYPSACLCTSLTTRTRLMQNNMTYTSSQAEFMFMLHRGSNSTETMPRHYFIPIIPFVFWRMSRCVQTFKEKQRECEYSLTDTVVLSAIASRARLLVLMLRRQWRSSRADWIRTQAWGRLVSLVSVFIQTTPPAETLNTVFRGTWRSNTHQYSIYTDLLNFVFITKALWLSSDLWYYCEMGAGRKGAAHRQIWECQDHQTHL